MRVAVIGGGPGGLFAAVRSAKVLGAKVVLYERRSYGSDPGLGIVLSKQTLDSLARDKDLWSRLEESLISRNRYTVLRRVDIDSPAHTVGWLRGYSIRRHTLVEKLTDVARQAGVELLHSTPAPSVDALSQTYDLVIAADGAGSQTRRHLANELRPSVRVGKSLFLWIPTVARLNDFQFDVRSTSDGVFVLHAYPDNVASTGVIEAVGYTGNPDHLTATALNLYRDVLPSVSVEDCEGAWNRFRTVTCSRWHSNNVVLLGDAAHTTHFSVGSGTKLALEDALTLVDMVQHHGAASHALTRYQEQRSAAIQRTQASAMDSQRWLENIGAFVDQRPAQFAFNLLARSGRMTYGRLSAGNPEFIQAVHSERFPGQPRLPPIEHEVRVGPHLLVNRKVHLACSLGTEEPILEPHSADRVSPAGLWIVPIVPQQSAGPLRNRIRRIKDAYPRTRFAARAKASLGLAAVRATSDLASSLGFDFFELDLGSPDGSDGTFAASVTEYLQELRERHWGLNLIAHFDAGTPAAAELIGALTSSILQATCAVSVTCTAARGRLLMPPELGYLVQKKVHVGSASQLICIGPRTEEQANTLILAGRCDLCTTC